MNCTCNVLPLGSVVNVLDGRVELRIGECETVIRKNYNINYNYNYIWTDTLIKVFPVHLDP